jgi:glycosyltransferase involved in cell wall biosynthesis
LNGLVSVVIPLYNKESYIIETLKSVMNQTYRNIECIIVDDGSTDSSVAVASKFISDNELPWILISQKNSGQTKARNHGIQLARGEYVAFLDSDDLWPVNKIELQVEAIEKNSKSVLVLCSYAIFSEGKSIPRVVKHRKSKKMNTRWLDMRGFGGGLESLGLLRRKTLDQVGLFDESLSTSSGLDLSLRLEKIGEIVLLKQLGLYYRISSGQWHSNPVALKQDLKSLREKHPQANQKDVSKFQESYFFWAAVRQDGYVAFGEALLKSFISADVFRLRMIRSLVLRNYSSRILGWLHRKETQRFLSAMGIRR